MDYTELIDVDCEKLDRKEWDIIYSFVSGPGMRGYSAHKTESASLFVFGGDNSVFRIGVKFNEGKHVDFNGLTPGCNLGDSRTVFGQPNFKGVQALRRNWYLPEVYDRYVRARFSMDVFAWPITGKVKWILIYNPDKMRLAGLMR